MTKHNTSAKRKGENKMIRYAVQDREAGNVIEYLPTREMAEELLEQFEKVDKEDGVYTPNFYEIVEV